MLSIPVLTVQGHSLAEAYENALISLHTHGTRFHTQYDKPGDPLSIDATMNITVEDPLADPMIHKSAEWVRDGKIGPLVWGARFVLPE